MDPKFPITISIVSHGDSKKIHALLASMQKREPNAKQFQLILTDNLKDELPNFDPSPWASLKILRNNQQMGFAKNHNLAYKIVNSEYFAILNPDIIFEQPVLERLINSLHNQKADLIAPQIVDENGIIQDSFRILPTPLELIRRRLPGYKLGNYQPDHQGMIHPDWVAGMFWLMRSETYRQLGGMDERYRLYFEDVDFCTRVQLRGMKILVDSHVSVRHEAQRSSRSNIYYLFLHTQSALRFFTSRVYRQARQNQNLSP